MADIQSATTEIRWGKKKKKNKRQDEKLWPAPALLHRAAIKYAVMSITSSTKFGDNHRYFRQ